jgi:tyrosyl-tRNA synthetase
MDVETKLELIKRPPTEEIITEEELKQVLETKDHPNHYIGFEISGLLHLGILFITGYKIKDFLEAGCNCCIFLADWHTFLNRKLGGDWEKIKRGAKYFEEAFRFFLGDHPRLKFVLGSELYHNNDEYWMNVMRIARATTTARITRCLTIMGRKQTEKLDVAQFIYPPMQAADILALNIDIAHAGSDQRKIHCLLRDIADKLGVKKPVAVHTHLLGGLVKPMRLGYDENPERDIKISSKMSKSKPWTCVFIHDTPEQIKEKLNKAWCPAGQVELNPVLELVKYIIFREMKEFEIERSQKFGGNLIVQSYEELEKLFKEKKIHPQDLKMSAANALSEILRPIREHFEKKPELLEVFKESEITR